MEIKSRKTFLLGVSANSCKGGVSLRLQALGVKCVEMGFKKKPSNAFYSKAAIMSAKRNTQKKSISGLKSSKRACCFQRRGSIDGADRRSSSKPGPWICTSFSA
jgi:hypothetical protein